MKVVQDGDVLSISAETKQVRSTLYMQLHCLVVSGTDAGVVINKDICGTQWSECM